VTAETDYYFQRFGFCERQIVAPVPQDLGLVIVIPCLNELDLIESLNSLWQCQRPSCAVEIVVVVNSSAESRDEIRLQNRKTLEEARAWAVGHCDSHFSLHLVHFPDLPPKQAGVGLARKIGMDEAVRRFDDIGRPGGIIVCFDADCRCQRNYLGSIERHFLKNPRSPGCSIYFEHPLSGAQADEGIAGYELHLRYYVQALRFAGFPYAHHTIGSCMAVRADAYTKQGGMNKRQAGEDFYFLQKIIPLGHFSDLTETAVFPSPRSSDRVPFGTGKAVRDYLTERQSWTYPLQAFLDLKDFFDLLSSLGRLGDGLSARLVDSAPESIRSFLKSQDFDRAMREIHENTATEAAFRKRFFHWFNGFQVMKFIHHARDQFYGKKSVTDEARKLLELKGEKQAADASVLNLLQTYRELDRRCCVPASPSL